MSIYLRMFQCIYWWILNLGYATKDMKVLFFYCIWHKLCKYLWILAADSIYQILTPSLKNQIFDLSSMQVAKDGIPLPPDRTICPLCSQKRANPSVVTVSGFVFCYACIHKYVSQVRPTNPICWTKWTLSQFASDDM